MFCDNCKYKGFSGNYYVCGYYLHGGETHYIDWNVEHWCPIRGQETNKTKGKPKMNEIIKEYMESIEQAQEDYLDEKIEIGEMDKRIEQAQHKFRILYWCEDNKK